MSLRWIRYAIKSLTTRSATKLVSAAWPVPASASASKKQPSMAHTLAWNASRAASALSAAAWAISSGIVPGPSRHTARSGCTSVRYETSRTRTIELNVGGGGGAGPITSGLCEM